MFSLCSRLLVPIALTMVAACGGSSSDVEGAPPTQNTSQPGDLVLEWRKPDERENGAYLEDFEIGGYELRFRSAGSASYQRLVINDGLTTTVTLPMQDLSSYTVEIAAFDTDGLHSRYVPLTPVKVIN